MTLVNHLTDECFSYKLTLIQHYQAVCLGLLLISIDRLNDSNQIVLHNEIVGWRHLVLDVRDVCFIYLL